MTTASPDIISSFAFAVAKPGGNAFLIDANNKKIGPWMPIDEAVEDGRALVVDVHPRILAIDADGTELGIRAEQFAHYLAQLGLSPVLVASGRPGNRHVLAFIPDLAQLAALEEEARSERFMTDGKHMDVRRMIRPPLAPHRWGLTPKLLYPTSVEEALAALERRS